MLDLLIGVMWALIGYSVCAAGWYLLFAVPAWAALLFEKLRTLE